MVLKLKKEQEYYPYESKDDYNCYRYYNLLSLAYFNKAEIIITPYILNGDYYELIEETENILLSIEDFQSFFALLETNHNALSIIVESNKLQHNSRRPYDTLYLSSLITFQEFTAIIQPLLSPNIENEVKYWKQLGCQYINIEFSQKNSDDQQNITNQ